MTNFLLSFVLLSTLAIESKAAWILKRVQQDDHIEEVGVSPLSTRLIRKEEFNIPKVLKSLPAYLVEHGKSSSRKYEEILWPYDSLPTSYSRFARSSEMKLKNSEFRTIIEQGPAENRICLTFVGDGYTESEKEKFYTDVAALVDDLFNGQTFQSYKSLFNVYAVFVASNESGISDVESKNTAFGLYRNPPGSKRAIMPGNTFALDQAIAIAPKTDYPIVIANDDFYGGLGGRYAITTSSRESGKIVLRHELGHNFGGVGEEYDGGYVYQGANSSRSTDISWRQWLKDAQAKIINDMRFLGGAYVWQNLAQKSVVQNFTFPAPNEKGSFWFEVQVSSVGWQSLEDVEILLDGRKLEILGRGTSDRSFFNTKRVQDLTPGKHQLEIREVSHDGDNILAFANLYAFEGDYDFNGGIGAFKTYDDGQRITYRPTHDKCIMRDMLSDFFCPVDQENMWLEFLSRIQLIDGIEINSEYVQLKTVAMPNLTTNWYKIENNQEIELAQFQNKFKLNKAELALGRYIVKVKFLTTEVRKSSKQLQGQQNFEIVN